MKKHRLLTALTFAFFITACGGPQHNKLRNPDFSEQSLVKLHSHYLTHQIKDYSVNLHAVSISDTKLHPVVMIHGTPGSWSTFMYLLGNTKLQASNHLISIDRLGWGKSVNTDPKKQLSDFDSQVEAIVEMIRSITDQPVILLGHSLGASLAPSVAIKYPDLVKGMILIAGTVDPDLGNPRWFNKLARWKIVQWLIPNDLVYSNQEIYALKPGLLVAKPQWKNLAIPITVIQGMKDKLVYPENVQFVEKQLSNKKELLNLLLLPESGHFIPWEETNKVAIEIQKMTKKFSPDR